MLRGIYCSNTGLNAVQHRVDVLANNLANVNTMGFKQEKTAITTFKESVIRINENTYFKTSNGSIPGITATDFSPGELRQTYEKFDFAVKGDAFFEVQTPNGLRYTKNGSFKCSKEGYLVDNKDNKVLGESGFIKVTDGKLDRNFHLVTVKNKENLIRTEDKRFRVLDQTEIYPAENTEILQGFLETSNVDSIYNMTELITAARNYSLNSRVLTSQDAVLKKSVEEIGNLK